jgi:hypothetical protein
MRLVTNIHPEFGHLGPSPQFLHAAKFALTALAVGAALGAASVLALGARLNAPAEPPLEIAQTEGISAAQEPGLAGTRGVPRLASQPTAPCSQQTWPYVERRCQAADSRRWRHVRVVAPDAPVPVQAEPAETAKPAAEPAKPAGAAAEAVKKHKSARKRSRNRDNEFEGARAFVAERADREWRRSYRGYTPRLGYWLDDRPSRRW